jgi:hypothetical protein
VLASFFYFAFGKCQFRAHFLGQCFAAWLWKAGDICRRRITTITECRSHSSKNTIMSKYQLLKYWLIILLASVSCSTAYGQVSIIRVDLDLTQMVYSSYSDKILGFTEGYIAHGNQLLFINPNSGALEKQLQLEGEPLSLAISKNGKIVFIGFKNRPLIRRYDLEMDAFVAPIPLYLPYQVAKYIEPLPQNPLHIVVSVASNYASKCDSNFVYHDLMRLPNVAALGDKMLLDSTGTLATSVDNDLGYPHSARYQIRNNGITKLFDLPNFQINKTQIDYQFPNFYMSNGNVYNYSGASLVLSHTFPNTNLLALESGGDHVYAHEYFPSDEHVIAKYKKSDFSLVQKFGFPYRPDYTLTKMISVGNGRLAFIERANYNLEQQDSASLLIYSERNCSSPQPATLGMSVSNSTPCYGDTVTLAADPGYSGYAWSNGMSGREIKVTQKPNPPLYYYVTLPDGCQSKTRSINSPTIFFKQKLQKTFQTSGVLKICPDATNAITLIGYSNGIISPAGRDIATFEVDQSGRYPVMEYQGTCISDTFWIQIDPQIPERLPIPKVTVIGDTIQCHPTKDVYLSVPEILQDGVIWGGNVGWGTDRIFTVSNATGIFTAAYLKNGCIGPSSAGVKLELASALPAPTIARLTTTTVKATIAGGADSVQWYVNGLRNYTYTKDTIPIQVNGLYNATFSRNGCVSGASNTLILMDTFSTYVSVARISDDTLALTASISTNLAVVNNQSITYAWSNGATTRVINVSQPQEYCVTITAVLPTLKQGVACVTIKEEDYLFIKAVISSGQPLNDNLVMVLYDITDTVVQTVDSLLTGGGAAIFSNLSASRKYIARAVPTTGSIESKLYFPTHYTNKINWTAADSLKLKVRLVGGNYAPAPYLITMRSQPYFVPGFCIISGAVNSFFTNGPDNTTLPPLAGMIVILYNASNVPIAYTVTNSTGGFSFNNLPPGTYRVSLNTPGFPFVTETVVLTVANPFASGVNFNLSNTSAAEINTELQWSLFPNPASHVIHVESPTDGRLQVFHLDGRFAFERQLVKGMNTVSISVLPRGMYLCVLKTPFGVSTKKLVVEAAN